MMCGVPSRCGPAPPRRKRKYQVWAIDQSNSFGKTFGGTLYIYDGKELERGHQGRRSNS